MWRSNANPQFRTQFAEQIFNQKYAHEGAETWSALARTLVNTICREYMPKDECEELIGYIDQMKFIPGGRYLYYAGRENAFLNNCYILRAEEDTREDWANLSWKSESCLMTGGGIGADYSVYRPAGTLIKRTGGHASGPIPKMLMINEIGRRVMQGGSRRSAIYASLDEHHADAWDFLKAKDWHSMPVGRTGLTYWDLKQQDFNFPAPLDMTNVSLNWGDRWLSEYQRTGEVGELFLQNTRQALQTAEPGFSFNFGAKAKETGRNAPVSADTYVLTQGGYVQVSEIIDTAASLWTGKQWAVATFKRTAEMASTVRVNMTGGRSIVADPTHEFLVERYHGKGTRRRKLVSIDRVPAGELKVGDVLHTSLPAPVTKAFDDVSYLRGYIYGDGSFTKRYSNRAEITFCSAESKACYKAVRPELFLSVNENDGRGFVRAYSVDDWYVGKSKAEFPALDPADLASFLAGLFDADGSYDAKYKRVRLASVHRSFLEGARRALEVLGIQSGITTGGTSSYGGRVGYLLVVNGSSISRFAGMIPTKRLKVDPFTPYRTTTIKVLSVTPDKAQDVFCCDVGVEEHSFCAEGVIISNCTEVTSADDSDVCNLGSVNMSRIESIGEFARVTQLGIKFLVCGTLKAKLPYEKIYQTREKNRRLGLGLMGVHEWLIQRGKRYEVDHELHYWLNVWKHQSEMTGKWFARKLGISEPVAFRAIAPTGTIGILAGTTTGIEPLFAVAYKRRFLKGTDWHYQFVVDGAAQELIDRYGADPEKIESAIDLAGDYERRIKFQADVQDYVDMAISSTINLPAWGTEKNNESTVAGFAAVLARYAPRLRGFTSYSDGARGGQPLTSVPYREAVSNLGNTYAEVTHHDICDVSGKGGSCGI